MNFESFMHYENADATTPAIADPSKPPAHFFDLTGWLWMLACVLFAASTGRLLPQLAEPGGLHATWVALAAQNAKPEAAPPAARVLADAALQDQRELEILIPAALPRF